MVIKLKVRIVLSFQLPFTDKMTRFGIIKRMPHIISTKLLSFLNCAMKNKIKLAAKTDKIGSQKSMAVVSIIGVGPIIF